MISKISIKIGRNVVSPTYCLCSSLTSIKIESHPPPFDKSPHQISSSASNMASTTSESKIERYNLYKSRMDQAANQVIRKILFLIRPDEDFPTYRVDDIEKSYNLWKDEEECFWRMTSTHVNPKRIFPAHPALYAPRLSCWRMWGLLIQQQVDDSDQSDLLDDCVEAILAAPRCQGDCPCKVPNNPWTSYSEMAALAPLNVSHNPRCHCGDYGVCEKKHEAMAAAAEALRVEAEVAKEKAKAESGGFPYEFCHCGDTQFRSCTCGKPAKAAVEYAKDLDAKGNLTPELAEMLCGKGWRKPQEETPAPVASATCSKCADSFSGKCIECYMKVCSYNSAGRMKAPDEIHMLRQGYYMEEEWYAKSKRKQREEEAEKKEAEAQAAQKEAKETFITITGRPGMAEVAGWHAHDAVSRHGMSAAEAVKSASKHVALWTWATPEAKAKRAKEAEEAEEAAEAAEAEAKPAEHSTNCMCGVCFWKREAKEGRYPPVVAPRPATVTRDLMPSQNIVSTITAACSNQDDLAKQIFASMGTPYDSKCPHGLPFYACMPCSH